MLRNDDLLGLARELAKGGQRLPTLLLLSHVVQPATPGLIRAKGMEVGFRIMRDWNLTDILRGAERAGLVAHASVGWKLLPPGLSALRAAGYNPEAPMIAETRHGLKKLVATVSDRDRRRFLEEAILCFEAGALRGAVVLAWVGAVSILQQMVVSKHLAQFNKAGQARFNDDFRLVRSTNDFGHVQEADFLQLMDDAGIIHKAEKLELKERLDLRNRCGHPNPFEVGEHAAAHHIESLLQNVYSR